MTCAGSITNLFTSSGRENWDYAASDLPTIFSEKPSEKWG